jgi:hypothetical protein
MGLPESLKQAGALANPTFFDKAYVCTVFSMSGDGTYSVVPKDTNIPTMIGIPYVGGGTAKILAHGSECLAVFDATGAAWLMGIKGQIVGADWVPLGTVLVSYLTTLYGLVTTHVHVAPSGSPPTPGFTGPIDGSVATTSAAMVSLPATLLTLLSTSVKVEP